MSPTSRALLAAASICSMASLGAQWRPHFELQTTTPVVAVGGQVVVEVQLSNIQADVAGYQCEVLFDPARLRPVSITQGPYLPFNTFFGNPGAFPDKIRIGALNLPTGSSLPPGPGQGLIATAVFDALTGGPANLDLTDFCLVSDPGGSGSRLGTRADLAVQVLTPTDTLAAHGRPNPGGTMTLGFMNAGQANKMFVSAASFSNSGLPIPGVGILPLGFDPLFQMAFANCCVYGNSVGTLDAAGHGTTTFTLPDDPRVLGLRIYFGTLVFQVTPQFQFLAVSNSTWVDYLSP